MIYLIVMSIVFCNEISILVGSLLYSLIWDAGENDFFTVKS